MKRADTCRSRSSVAAFVAAAFLSACAGSTGAGSPGGVAARPLGDAPFHTGSNALAGQYTGQGVDTVFGTGKLKASLAQSNGSVGGSVTVAYQQHAMNSSLAGTYANASLTGVEVATVNTVACAFSYKGKYDSSTHTLSLQFDAVHGCKGESGTLTLKKQCFYQESFIQSPDETPALRMGIRPDAGGLHGC